jgi:hypothetical protein
VTKKEIMEGIAAYKEMQDEIIAAIDSAPEGLDQNGFDKIFSGTITETLSNGETVIHRKNPIIKVIPYNSKSFILGTLYSCDEWSRYLHLTQLMCSAGILNTTEENGKIVYRKV